MTLNATPPAAGYEGRQAEAVERLKGAASDDEAHWSLDPREGFAVDVPVDDLKAALAYIADLEARNADLEAKLAEAVKHLNAMTHVAPRASEVEEAIAFLMERMDDPYDIAQALSDAGMLAEGWRPPEGAAKRLFDSLCATGTITGGFSCDPNHPDSLAHFEKVEEFFGRAICHAMGATLPTPPAEE